MTGLELQCNSVPKKRYDPDMTKYDLANGKDLPHSVRMAKPMWIFEQLRKEKPDIFALYLQ